MALLTLAQAKAYLRIDTDETSEDALLTELIDECQADMESRIGCLITAAETTEYVSVTRNQTHLTLRNHPITQGSTMTITDPNGDGLDQDYFYVDYNAGVLYTGSEYGQRMMIDPPGIYKVVYTGGMSNRPDWANVQVVLRGALREYVAARFLNRNPGAKSEGGLGQSTSLHDGMPPKVANVCDRYRVPL